MVSVLTLCRSNFVGTEFTVFDKGEKPNKDGDVQGLAPRQEIAAVIYVCAYVPGASVLRHIVFALRALEQQSRVRASGPLATLR